MTIFNLFRLPVLTVQRVQSQCIDVQMFIIKMSTEIYLNICWCVCPSVRPSVCNVMLFIAKIEAKARAKQTLQSTV